MNFFFKIFKKIFIFLKTSFLFFYKKFNFLICDIPNAALISLNLKFNDEKIKSYFQCLLLFIIPCERANNALLIIFFLFVVIKPPSPVVID